MNICQCGCGTEIPAVTKKGTPQRFARGHHTLRPLDSRYVLDDRGHHTPCWIWTGSKSGGYGLVRRNGRLHKAHRWFFEAAGNDIPTGLRLDHLCQVTSCVNPDHLEPVSAAENAQRGRNAKLTPADVEEIRDARRAALEAAGLDGRPQTKVPGGERIRRELADRYGVTPNQIKHIWLGSCWAA